uniref:Uncharacterized protein n=1 Tax=Nelumbo nucifera TaxID=4432 RepID=A0A822XAB4_NELNU|nr:TPA_asm: hypothetical protein HUJ06_019847 [Nelumbo nucifera]
MKIDTRMGGGFWNDEDKAAVGAVVGARALEGLMTRGCWDGNGGDLQNKFRHRGKHRQMN